MYHYIKHTLLEYHRARGFTLYDTFPLVSNDPTILFTNATITPFKYLFEQHAAPHNYALVQRCLRVGGGAGEIETARVNPNYSSLFEMFGSGIFGYHHQEAVEYFIDLLINIGIPIENLRFIVPESKKFSEALLACGTMESSIFSIGQNGKFWYEWHFGQNGLIGNGITAVFARYAKQMASVDEMATDHKSFVEIGNLIHIHAKASSDNILPISHEGFDIGIGVARLMVILQNKSLYELPPFNEFIDIVALQMSIITGTTIDMGTLRVIVDHLRSIDALIQTGLRPGNKQHAFVLRKLIRSVLEIIWVCARRIISPIDIVTEFAHHDAPESVSVIENVLAAEERIFHKVLKQGRKILEKNPGIDPKLLASTYGIRQSLIPLIRGE